MGQGGEMEHSSLPMEERRRAVVAREREGGEGGEGSRVREEVALHESDGMPVTLAQWRGDPCDDGNYFRSQRSFIRPAKHSSVWKP